jgi:hypothetical protein
MQQPRQEENTNRCPRVTRSVPIKTEQDLLPQLPVVGFVTKLPTDKLLNQTRVFRQYLIDVDQRGSSHTGDMCRRRAPRNPG